MSAADERHPSPAEAARRMGVTARPELHKEISPRLIARIAGLLYLLIIAGSLFIPFAFPPTGLMMSDAALPTAAIILAAKQSYTLSGAALLILGACDIYLALVFYELLKPVSRRLALLATFFRLVFVAIANANLFNYFAPLVLLTDPGFAGAFNSNQLHALVLLFVRLRTTGFDVALVFFGFHCALLGYLLFRSTFFPRVLGLLMMIGGAGYLANILAGVVPVVFGLHLFPYIILPAGLAELLLAIWLTIVGINLDKWRLQARLWPDATVAT